MISEQRGSPAALACSFSAKHSTVEVGGFRVFVQNSRISDVKLPVRSFHGTP
jgi:hypothetical protein